MKLHVSTRMRSAVRACVYVCVCVHASGISQERWPRRRVGGLVWAKARLTRVITQLLLLFSARFLFRSACETKFTSLVLYERVLPESRLEVMYECMRAKQAHQRAHRRGSEDGDQRTHQALRVASWTFSGRKTQKSQINGFFSRLAFPLIPDWRPLQYEGFKQESTSWIAFNVPSAGLLCSVAQPACGSLCSCEGPQRIRYAHTLLASTTI